ncbi:alpha-ketoglutarate-dependent dioxygenase alkB-like protein 6 [Iris pallida]|uniref:Alpha-ketoglutarate-dependent dioxygenase alkB-like protein 6 n=1 Tax=Iris pallida TaxID=29817 RepID=A0AAX6F2Y1_IRIPA|nr:alpha-ketoglutarate-dependent dioxygenase alkB-like protein 6 [Iris pallida]KAJ6839318.1 alpha-ketoglutarate-dependent dioxygenase alkB-like protein 6 [Iris pallida]
MAEDEGYKMEQEQEVELQKHIVGSLPTIFYIPNFITNSEQAQLLHHIYEVPASRWKSLKNRRLQNWGGVVHEKGLLPQDLPPWLTKFTQRIFQQTGLFPSAINHVLINEYLPNQGIMPHQDGPAYYPIVAILSLESPVVIDFTPHLRLKGRTEKEGIAVKGSDNNVTASDDAIVSSNKLICRTDDIRQPCSLLLMPCSLLLFKDEAYSDYLHSIQDSELHRVDKVVNASETLKLEEQKLGDAGETIKCTSSEGQSGSFCRTSTRVSLTCRLVLKVKKNLFKF